MPDMSTTEPETRAGKAARPRIEHRDRGLAEHPELAAVRDAMLVGSEVLDGTIGGFVAHSLGVSRAEVARVGLTSFEDPIEYVFPVSPDTFDEMCDAIEQPAKVNAALLDAAQTSRVFFGGRAGETTTFSE